MFEDLISFNYDYCCSGYGYHDEEVEELDDLFVDDELFHTTYGYTSPSWNV
jgi:hypothetical protein